MVLPWPGVLENFVPPTMEVSNRSSRTGPRTDSTIPNT